MILVLITTIIAIVAYPLVSMNGWLNEYAYRIALTAKPFILSLIALLFLTALLIVAHTIKVAMLNPVKSLKQNRE